MKFCSQAAAVMLCFGSVALGQSHTLAQTSPGSGGSITAPDSASTDRTSPSTASGPVTVPAAPGTYLLTSAPKPAASLIDVQDQVVSDGRVYLGLVEAPARGYVVIHESDGGRPGDVLGYVPVEPGGNKDVIVPIRRLPRNGQALAVVHSGVTSKDSKLAVLGRFDPVTYLPARGGNKSAIASFMIRPSLAAAGYGTGSSVSSTVYQRQTTTTEPDPTATPGSTTEPEVTPPTSPMSPDRSTTPSTTTPPPQP